MKSIYLIIYLSLFVNCFCEEKEDLYKLLGVSRDATVKEIRKAFKVLAVKLHPDKNKDDEDADAKFVRITKAYEILKDPDTRKKYDLYGDTGSDNSNNRGQQYHSYSYYRDHFGIYDDDPLIVTLSRSDFEVNVLDNNQAWFVNFYSPQCHHCHDLAPTWRKLAAELEGVVRVAAVNCEDDWSLCYQLSITSYPTLLYYEKEANIHEGIRFRGSRTFDDLKDFVISKIKTQIKSLDTKTWEDSRYSNWILFICPNEENCPETETRLKLSAILDGLIPVGLITYPDLCKTISKDQKSNIVFWQYESETHTTIHSIQGSDTKEILDNILSILPNPPIIDEKKFQDIRTQLRSGSETPWLICFYLGQATDLDLQLKRLPIMIPSINIGMVHCARSLTLCQSLHVARYPAWGVLKVGGAFELHHGRDVLHEIASFARDSTKSTNLHALSPADFLHIMDEGSTWFIDWYAPWCPPCKQLMPELRRASQHFDSDIIQFGTVDCTLHRSLCSKQGISSYPTIMLYNGTRTHRFQGMPSEEGIVEFIRDMLNPLVITLDDSSFVNLMRKPKNEIWIVDYFAPWCGPCQRLAPEWRRLAKEMAEIKEVKVAQVDCQENADLCTAQNVKSYPTIRLYPLESKGLSSVAIYNGNRDATSIKRWIFDFIPSSIVSLNAEKFKEQILSKRFILPWLVEFYAPWCGHCTDFEPEFRKVAQRLEGIARTGKVNCENERFFCGQLYINSYPSMLLYISPQSKFVISGHNAGEIVRDVKGIIAEYRTTLDQHDEL